LGTRTEQYTMARAIIGGLMTSVVLTTLIVPAADPLVYYRHKASKNQYAA
jgi:Cu/Ag efflux pump CusA